MNQISSEQIIKNNKEIMNYLIEIKEDIAGIKEHLKTLNGKVITNVKDIECRRLENKETDGKVRRLEIKIAYFLGGLMVIWTIAQIVIDKLL
jgi:hypothetical protein